MRTTSCTPSTTTRTAGPWTRAPAGPTLPLIEISEVQLKPVYQTKFGWPDGNCWVACIATILELPLGELRPIERMHRDMVIAAESATFGQHDDIHEIGWRKIGGWMVGQLGVLCLSLNFVGADGSLFPSQPYMAVGPGPRERLGHCVVMENGQLAHDPHPDGGGLVEVNHLEILIPVAI